MNIFKFLTGIFGAKEQPKTKQENNAPPKKKSKKKRKKKTAK